jgi:glycosyltransferase involved in cell wall biosynthesis
MKISILSDLVRPNGAGVMALLQADLLASRGHEVHLLAGAATDSLRWATAHSGSPVHSFSSSEYVLDHPVDVTEHQELRRSVGNWIEQQLDELRPDVATVHNCGRILDQHFLADLSHRYPLALTAHDEWFFSDAHYSFDDGVRRYRSFEPHRAAGLGRHGFDHLFEVERRAGHLMGIAPSRWLQRRWQRVYPDLPCVHLHNPVDNTLFDIADRTEARAALGIPEAAGFVLFVGNPNQPRKGLSRLAEALSLLPDETAPLLVVAGGDGSTAGHLARSSLDPGVLADLVDANGGTTPSNHAYSARSITIGGFPRELMNVLYNAAGLVVHPSWIDNLPTVPIEAGLAGTRCLATDVGGTAETLAESDGLLAAGIAAPDLARRIATELPQVAAEPPETRTARRAVHTSTFCPQTHVERLEGLLLRLADSSPR